MSQWLRLHFHYRGHRFNPGQGTKIPQAWQHGHPHTFLIPFTPAPLVSGAPQTSTPVASSTFSISLPNRSVSHSLTFFEFCPYVTFPARSSLTIPLKTASQSLLSQPLSLVCLCPWHVLPPNILCFTYN